MSCRFLSRHIMYFIQLFVQHIVLPLLLLVGSYVCNRMLMRLRQHSHDFIEYHIIKSVLSYMILSLIISFSFYFLCESFLTA